MTTKKDALPINMTGKTVAELVSLGCKFVVDGNVFSAVITLVDKLVTEAAADPSGVKALLELRAILLQTSVPVRSKIGDEGKIVLPT